jgi:hypothetical protein
MVWRLMVWRLMVWRRRAAEEANGVGQRGGDQQCRLPDIPFIAEPVGNAKTSGRRQIMPHVVLLLALTHRSREEQGHQPGENKNGKAVKNGLQSTGLRESPCRTTWHKTWVPALPAIAATLLTACNPEVPTGQVIAVVNGEEITTAELNAEARARNLTIGTDAAQRDLAIADLVKRKLLVQAAEGRGLDRTPEFVVANRRLRDILLAQQLVAVRSAELGDQEEAPEAGESEQTPSPEERQQRLSRLAELRMDRTVAQIVSEQQKQAVIKYQEGFEPVPTPR